MPVAYLVYKFPIFYGDSKLITVATVALHLPLSYASFNIIAWPTHFNFLKTEFLHNFIYKYSPYLTGNTLRLRYKCQPVNAVWENSRCLL
jgi:hypothetical protein